MGEEGGEDEVNERKERARARTGKSVAETDGEMCTEGGELTKACPRPFNGIVLCPSQWTETRTVWIGRQADVLLMDVLLQEFAQSHLLVPGSPRANASIGGAVKSHDEMWMEMEVEVGGWSR